MIKILGMLLCLSTAFSLVENEPTEEHVFADEKLSSAYKTIIDEKEGNVRIPRSISRMHKPTGVGSITIYIRSQCSYYKKSGFVPVRFPIAQYNQRDLLPSRAWTRYSQSINFYVDRENQHTIIDTRNRVYTIPGLLNRYGQLFSVGDLLNDGYAKFPTDAGAFDLKDYRKYGRKHDMYGTDRYGERSFHFRKPVQTDFGSDFEPPCQNENDGYYEQQNTANNNYNSNGYEPTDRYSYTVNPYRRRRPGQTGTPITSTSTTTTTTSRTTTTTSRTTTTTSRTSTTTSRTTTTTSRTTTTTSRTTATTTTTTTSTTSNPCRPGYVIHPNGDCVNLVTDPDNCGQFDNVCEAPTVVCSNGQCVEPTVLLSGGVRIFNQNGQTNVDDLTSSVSLPFNISLYNVQVSSVTVSSNGVICLGGCSSAFTNGNLPSSSFAGPTVFGYWDDLYMSSGTSQSVYYGTLGTAPNRNLVFEYYTSRYQQASAFTRFQIVFFENTPNFVQILYFQAIDRGASATIGTQASGTGPSMRYAFNAVDSVPEGSPATITPLFILPFNTN